MLLCICDYLRVKESLKTPMRTSLNGDYMAVDSTVQLTNHHYTIVGCGHINLCTHQLSQGFQHRFYAFPM